MITRIIPSRDNRNILPHIRANVVEGTRVMTDAARGFRVVAEYGYRHQTVNHQIKEYVRDDVHTNTIEGFWANVKRTIQGTHIHVSKKWLQTYLWECEYRHNLRKQPHLMFDLLLKAFPRAV